MSTGRILVDHDDKANSATTASSAITVTGFSYLSSGNIVLCPLSHHHNIDTYSSTITSDESNSMFGSTKLAGEKIVNLINGMYEFVTNHCTGHTHTDPEKPGTPEITTDPEGNVIAYEQTETASIEGDTNVDTGFIAFNGNNWTMHLYAKFAYSDNSSAYYPTILNAMQEVSPWNGFIVRYEGSTLYLVEKSTHWSMSVDSSNCINMYFTYKDGTLTVTNNGTTICNQSISYTIDGLTISLGSSVDSSGNPQRYAVCEIYEFSVSRTD